MARKIILRSAKTTQFGPFSVIDARLQVEDKQGALVDLERVVFERGDSVAVLLRRRDTDCVVLSRQFRYPARVNRAEASDGWLIETPAGVIEANETPERAARREIEEEVGYQIEAIEHIATFFVSPGGTSERILLFSAFTAGPRKGGGGVRADAEDIEILEVPTGEFLDLVARNVIRDGKTLMAGYWLMAQRS